MCQFTTFPTQAVFLLTDSCAYPSVYSLWTFDFRICCLHQKLGCLFGNHLRIFLDIRGELAILSIKIEVAG